MGVSGAGKTTLMDVLAGRKTGGWTGFETASFYLPVNGEAGTILLENLLLICLFLFVYSVILATLVP